MSLQVFFVFVQIYGWWYWLRGDAGKRPPITTWPARLVALLSALGFIFAILASAVLNALTDARMAFWDSAIFGLSVIAQFLLDRKKLENWIVWAGVDAISICVYASQGLWLTAALYTGLLLNAAWGYVEWRREFLELRAVAGGASS
jgi:nicotinamide mononucleotide transporter